MRLAVYCCSYISIELLNDKIFKVFIETLFNKHTCIVICSHTTNRATYIHVSQQLDVAMKKKILAT